LKDTGIREWVVFGMTRSQTNRRVSRSRKKQIVPLSKLRTSEAVRTIVDHPRRLEELAGLLEDRDVMLRERGAATIARLAESHPARLVRIIERLKVGLADDSAYVRWHVVYALGRLGFRFPARALSYLSELAGCLADDNRVVRSLALRALTDLAVRKPEVVLEVFSSKKQVLPPPLDRILRSAGRRPERPGRPVD
jgi:hypothetical protein